MTRKSRREIERAVADLADLDKPDGPDTWIVPFVSAPEDSDIDLSPFVVEEEPDADDPIDTYEHVELPVFKPRSVRGGGITVVDPEDIVRLWSIMPDETRERELEYRIEHGKPIPPVLQE